MHPFFQRPGVRRIRFLFRWFRVFVLLILFLAVAAVCYLHLIGLPDFVKRPLLRRLLAEGVAAQFTNMQLGWARGPSILIENADFSRSDQPLSPRLSASRAELALSGDALLHSQIALRSLQISSAQLQLPISQTNGDALLLTNVALDMRFYSNDVVLLNSRGTFIGIQLDLIGEVNHAGGLSHWRLPLGGGATNAAFQDRLRQVAQTVQEIRFTGTPRLQIEAWADGQDMNSFQAELDFAASAAHTPWGDVTNLVLDATCARLIHSGNEPLLKVGGSAASLAARLAWGRQISFSTIFSRGANSNLDAQIRLDAAPFHAASDSAGSNWFGAACLSWNGAATLASSNFIPLLAAGKLRALEPQSPWGSARELSLDCRTALARDVPPPEAGWGPWTRISPWTFDWQAEMRNVTSPKLCIDHLAFTGHWLAPQLVIENLQGELYHGQVNAGAILDVGSRELHCNGVTDFSPLSISQLFKPSDQKFLEQFDFTTPPKVHTRLRVVLPPWTNRPAGWSADVSSSLQLAGDFTAGPSSFCGVPVLSASSHITHTNRVWHVSGLHAVRPDGEIDLDYTSGPQAFHYVIDSHLAPRAALPLVAPGRPHLLDEFAFTQPPHIQAEIWGRWHGAGVTGVTGVAATVQAANFIARGEPVAAFSARVEYTNLILTVHNLCLSNDQCQAQSPWLQVDFGTKRVRLTNVTGTLDPPVLQRVLRGNSPGFLDVIHFDAPPSVLVSGSFSLTNSLATDLRFLVSGQRLHYTNLLADRVTGVVDWSGPTVTLTNISANLYNNGTLMGWIVFGGGPGHGSDFRADFTARDIDLSSLATGITGKTNHVEGRLDGHLALNSPDNPEGGRGQGYGDIHAHDALLWDIKLFGLLSPVLNMITPGWGHSRVREATGTFVITNGTISSDDLQLRCQGFVLNLRGTVDRNKQINARLEAVLPRGTPVFGSFLSLAFTPVSKMFEYHITGPVRDPVLEPVYVPKFILFLLHPFRSLKSLATPDSPPESAPP
jgi:hypothetical protein